jgi:ribosome-binding factor A
LRSPSLCPNANNQKVSRRTERVAELLRQELSNILLDELHDPRIGFLTLTRVEVSPDLRYVKVFITAMGDDTKERTVLRGLSSAEKYIRRRLGESVQLRRVPEVTFHIDADMKQSVKMNAILAKLAQERETQALNLPDEDGARQDPQQEVEHDVG